MQVQKKEVFIERLNLNVTKCQTDNSVNEKLKDLLRELDPVEESLEVQGLQRAEFLQAWLVGSSPGMCAASLPRVGFGKEGL